MIKKDIKTLSEFKSPTPESRWRIHLDDGSWIDVNGSEERNATIIRLVRDGRITANPEHSLRIQSLRGAEHITTNINITRTETEEVQENKTVWKSLKSDIGEWSWPLFFTRMGLSSVAALLIVILQYIISGPIKIENETIPFIQLIPIMVGLTGLMSASIWCLWKAWIILPYITCWIKIALFLCIYLLSVLTVGLITRNNVVVDKIMSFIGKHTMTNKELEIIKITTE